MSLILNHVYHTYGEGTTLQVHALQDICLTINDGDFIGLIGHTGSGKSNTLAKLYREVVEKYDKYPKIQKNAHFVLIDFNATRKINLAKKDTVIMGTVGYASPEQLGVAQSDARTDIYALGVLLNVMITGKHPSEKLAKGKAGRIVRKCTSVNPDERYQSAEKLANTL